MHSITLPQPETHAIAISDALRGLIIAEINASGPIPFQRYMELALYAPGLGYYSAGARKFGADGDFVTAPELGSVFAQVLGSTLAPLLDRLVNPLILELGAGSGALAAELLIALRELDGLPQRYLILERSADLRERQRETFEHRLPELLPIIEWLERPPAEDFEGIVLANEVVDALACARFRIAANGICELGVDHHRGVLQYLEQPPRRQVIEALGQLFVQLPEALPCGYTSELLPELGAWFGAVAEHLRRGLVVIGDYGYGRPEYYRQERHEGTLQCHYRHRVHSDPFWYPGLNDITASVDFTALAQAAQAAGFELAGYDSQSGFLRAGGVDQVFARYADAPELTHLRVVNEIRKLMLPGEMGERFKVFAASRGLAAKDIPGAFAGSGQRHLL